MQHARALLRGKTRLIDLAADFRLKDIQSWEKWYGMPHACPGLFAEAVYGLPEVNRAEIKTARHCRQPRLLSYRRAARVFCRWLSRSLWIPRISSRTPSPVSVAPVARREVHALFAEASDNFRAYGVPGHRHWPEICQGARRGDRQRVSV